MMSSRSGSIADFLQQRQRDVEERNEIGRFRVPSDRVRQLDHRDSGTRGEPARRVPRLVGRSKYRLGARPPSLFQDTLQMGRRRRNARKRLERRDPRQSGPPQEVDPGFVVDDDLHALEARDTVAPSLERLGPPGLKRRQSGPIRLRVVRVDALEAPGKLGGPGSRRCVGRGGRGGFPLGWMSPRLRSMTSGRSRIGMWSAAMMCPGCPGWTWRRAPRCISTGSHPLSSSAPEQNRTSARRTLAIRLGRARTWWASCPPCVAEWTMTSPPPTASARAAPFRFASEDPDFGVCRDASAAPTTPKAVAAAASRFRFIARLRRYARDGRRGS